MSDEYIKARDARIKEYSSRYPTGDQAMVSWAMHSSADWGRAYEKVFTDKLSKCLFNMLEAFYNGSYSDQGAALALAEELWREAASRRSGERKGLADE